MKRIANILLILAAFNCANAQTTGMSRLLGGLQKAVQAFTISDSDLQQYVHQYIEQQDASSTVLPAGDKYVVRLANLTKGLTEVDGLPLNFKVYQTNDVNAFACADGSVRVYTGLMGLMTDDEILGVIGHEVGHVAHKDSKNAFKNAILTSAAKDALAATSSKIAMLTDSQLGAIGEKLANARYSRKQEDDADDYGYEFLKKSGKNPWAMAMAFEKLKSLEGTSSSAKKFVNNLFSDHPDTQKRIERMAQRATADGFSRPVNNATAVSSGASSTSSKATAATAKKLTSSKSKSVKKAVTTSKKVSTKKATSR